MINRLPRIFLYVLPALLPALPAWAQTGFHIGGTVQDVSGRPADHATVTATGPRGNETAVSNRSGRFGLTYPAPGEVTLKAQTANMQSEPVRVDAHNSSTVVLTLRPSVFAQQVTITATRSSIDLPATANTTYALNASDLRNYPAITLDDKLRQQAGFELFRRSSSRVQNPTSQGISLRGLGSTAASRTLVLEENVPLNDPFGGWIHWNEIPQDAVAGVALATGGGSDLYGSSALGGVIDVALARPSTSLLDISAIGGAQDSSSLSGRIDTGGSHYRQLLAVDGFRTAGYIPIAPSLAGPIDRPANVHYQTVRSETDRLFSGSNRLFLIGNVLNEARNNGTSIQNNATRLWRYIGGTDWSVTPEINGRARLFGSNEGYRQSFSSTNAARNVENLTRLQRVRSQELGASADASAALNPVAIVGGFDIRDIRATDNETPIASGRRNGLANTSARQRFTGGFGEALGSHGPWSAALSLRLDSVANLDTVALAATSATAPETRTVTPNRTEFIVSPRFGIVRQLSSAGTIHASVFRAFRTPTMNELYRTGQVGQETTLANSALTSERATGWEVGAHLVPTHLAAISATYFWTEINRPVSAVLVSSTATTITNRRENLGQIISQGTELHVDIAPTRPVSATLGYQYAHAVVTSFSAQPGLVGKWIPQVPRQSFTAQVRAARHRLGEVTLALRATGRGYDDSSNTFELDPFVSLGLFARHDFGPHWTASLLLDNLTNERSDVARTPNLSLGSPLTAQGGLAFHWSRN
ncbi:MAG TPA: TonB-dependent receptor [Acidobacteriaceae bacterium]|nr:TonB-dependent receptor [Acidobacteriaceae bacterium]